MSDTENRDNAADGGLRTTDLLSFLRGKLADAEQSLRSREEMANPPRISEEEWEALKARPGTIMTKGRKLSKAALKEIEMEPLRHKRIAAKIRREVEMFKGVIDALSQLNDEMRDRHLEQTQPEKVRSK